MTEESKQTADDLVPVGVGITQSIRARLNFTDDYKWKRFSARRLELIDELDLSYRKASEQDEKINLVANTLREEYGFPEEALSDFHKLVRAGIQSVRRNRKRSYLKGSGQIIGAGSANSSTTQSPVLGSDRASNTGLGVGMMMSQAHAQATTTYRPFANRSPDTEDDDNNNILPVKRPRPIRPPSQNTDRISITSLITPSPSTSLPPMSSLSLSSPNNPREDLFILALERLQQFTCKLTTHMAANSNTEFLGQSIMFTAAAYAVERRLPNHDISDTVRSYVLSYPITSALVKALSLDSFSLLKTTLASCCREYGFDTIIHSLSTLYYEMFNIDPTFDLTNSLSYDRMASILASTSTNRIVKSGLISAPLSTITSLTSAASTVSTASTTSTTSTASTTTPPRVQPVTLRFRDQKLEFTYTPARASSPPTIAEVLDNGRNAFSINKDQPIQIENKNHPGRILTTDADVADTFTEARIDIELHLLQRQQPPQLPLPIHRKPDDRPKFQELL